MLNRDAIQSTPDLRLEKVFVPVWKDHVFVRSLTGEERDRFEQSNIKRDKENNVEINLVNVRARLVAMSCCDDKGERIFKDEDAAWLGQKNAGALSAIYEVAARLSGITKEDIKDIVKN